MLSTLSALGIAPSTLRRSTAPVHRSTQLPGAPPNVWLLPLPEKTLSAAKAIFDEALAPHLAAGMIEELATQPIPYRQLDGPRGRFFCMRAGSSTDEKKAALSDLAWISVDDDATFDAMLLPAEPAGAEPQLVRLPLRADYLYAITESLASRAGGVGAPLGMHARYAGQATEQPVLYFQIVTPPAASQAWSEPLVRSWFEAGGCLSVDAVHVEPSLNIDDLGDGLPVRELAQCDVGVGGLLVLRQQLHR